ncbi:MAG: lipopolysaccharide transport periplasmic protein LptA [Deltaproteobacteria bacterium HGW-Deltaproteobacteria-12]|jgi:lipopolysaccharide export system protein LptA|nr:MAG: lipopolysaccharide transport periplasmic protein LptA [Deltaproteobacteria bacterium HGW-Deltaproteobacteria-12]
MKSNKIFILFTFFVLLFFSSVQAKDNPVKINKINSKEPIEIVSDRMDAFNEKKLVVFSGNAVATQGDKEIKSDRLLLYYKKEAGKKDKVGAKEVEGTGDLEKIEAKGNVVVTQKERIATGDEAVYFQDSGQIIMTGNATLRDGKNLIKGDKVTVFVNEDRGVVESDPKKRVKAVIYPQEKNENKK